MAKNLHEHDPSSGDGKGGPTDILIVEDEPDVAYILKRAIESCGDFDVRLVGSAEEFEAELLRRPPDIVFTDLMMPVLDGFELIRRALVIDPDLPIIVISGYSSIDNAVKAVKEGAFDFLPKPFSPESFQLVLAKVERELGLRRRAREAAERDPDLDAIRGNGPLVQRLREWIRRIRDTQANVLIEGESGTGKELVARAIHGGRGPFLAINMAAVPDSLAEAELFGYRKGAFTGALADKKGLMEEAHHGTLFLDEINAATMPMQGRLLRALQERKIRPVGSTSEVPVDFRLICASNRPLEELVLAGQFRRDLYHRLNTLAVRVPPLRERRIDIPVLVDHFVHRYARAHGRRACRFSAEAMTALVEADWPGNIRELENAIEQAVILCSGKMAEIPVTALPPALGGQGWQFGDVGESVSRPKTLAEVEMNYILTVLRQVDGNKAEAARILDIGYKTLLRKLESAADGPAG
ncbi:MAG: sigma-54 dependent transcriptional regulator [Magnetospirillum sp.]|nr:sigma-54 dependent transcriptional regulator [Magnetospirillum sp.]